MPSSAQLPKIGVFLPLEFSWTGHILEGVARAATEFNLRLIIYGCQYGTAFQQAAGRFPLELFGYEPDQLDGTIMFFCEKPLIARLEALHQRGHRCVLVGRVGGDIPHVLPDDEGSMAAIVRRLHRHGHRRIAFVQGPTTNDCAARRFRGYRLGLATAGLAFDPDLVFDGEFLQENAADSVTAGLARGVRFTAVIAGNDASALGTLRALKAHNIKVPEQVELVGFDNIFGAPLADPPLTTFQIPMDGMAHASVAAMARLLRGDRVPLETTVPAMFINRASTRLTDVDPELDGISAPAADGAPAGPVIADLLKMMPENGTVEDVLMASQKILTEAIRLDLDLDEVSAAFTDRATASPLADADPEGHRRVLLASRSLVLATNHLTRIKATEHAHLFGTMTLRLRSLAVETLDDAMIIDVLGETLHTLGFKQARLYLQNARGEDVGPEDGRLYSWDFAAASQTEIPASRHEIGLAACEIAKRFPLTFVLPLIVNDTVIGNLIADGVSPFREELAELERHVTGALHSTRLYRALARGNETLRQSEYLYSSLVRSLPQIIVRKDAEGRIIYANDGFAALVGHPLDAILGRTEDDLFPADFAIRSRAEDRRIIETGQPLDYEHVTGPETARRFLQIKKTPLCDAAGKPVGVQMIYWDVTPFRETEARLRETQRELIDVSRRAGIAEVATGVLHNIGNALNGVNTSAGLVTEQLHDLKIESVGKLKQLLERESEPWTSVFTQDERGRKVIGFVHALESVLEQKRAEILQEVKALRDGVEHVNHIVAAQQEFAQATDLVEEQDASESVDYALRLCEAALLRHEIAVSREYLPVPRVRMDRHKAVQILVNFIRNATESLIRSRRADKLIRVGVRLTATGRVRCYVADNGVGVAPEDIARVFTMGFSTKEGGHGFGLHNSALTAASLGGSLHVESEGISKGATFLFDLPLATVP